MLRSNTHHLRYPELLELLAQTRYESYGSDKLKVIDGKLIDDLSGNSVSDPVLRNTQRLGKVVVPSGTSPNTTIEFSRPQNIAVADNMIYGTVEMRVLSATDSEPQRITFRSERTIRNEAEDARLIGLLEAANVVWDTDRPSTFLADHGFSLLMIGILILVGFMMIKRLGGVGSPMAFGRSRGKLYGQEDLAITFEDVAGIDEAVEEVREVVDFLKHPDKYQQLGARIPRGVLLSDLPVQAKRYLPKHRGRSRCTVLRTIGQ